MCMSNKFPGDAAAAGPAVGEGQMLLEESHAGQMLWWR